MVNRRDRSSPAMVLASIQQTGTELIRQVGIAAAMYPNNDRVPRNVLIAVIHHCSALHTQLFEHVATIERTIEADTAAAVAARTKRDE